MTPFGKESGSAFGRGWDASGFMGLLKAWIVKPVGVTNHGPGWYIYEDQSAAGTDPYIVVTNQASPTLNSQAKFLKITLPTTTGSRILIQSYLWWEIGVGGSFIYSTAYLTTVDAGVFGYYFRGNSSFLALICYTPSISFFFIDDLVPIWDGVYDLIEPDTAKSETLYTVPRVVTSSTVFNTKDSWRTINASSARASYHTDGSLTAVINDAGGGNRLVRIYKEPSMTTLVAHTGSFGTSYTGSLSLTADNSSGISGAVSPVTAIGAAAIDIPITIYLERIWVSSGEGSLFTPDHYYYAYTLSLSGNSIVRFFKVTNVSGDQLTVEYNGGTNFHAKASALISPKPHRFVVGFTHDSPISSYSFQVYHPYCAEPGAEWGGANTRGITFDYPSGLITRMKKNLRNRFPGFFPWCIESTAKSGDFADSRLFVGYLDNILISSNTGVSPLLWKRTLDSIEYLVIDTTSGVSISFRDSESD
jgi:hypothetical protein